MSIQTQRSSNRGKLKQTPAGKNRKHQRWRSDGYTGRKKKESNCKKQNMDCSCWNSGKKKKKRNWGWKERRPERAIRGRHGFHNTGCVRWEASRIPDGEEKGGLNSEHGESRRHVRASHTAPDGCHRQPKFVSHSNQDMSADASASRQEPFEMREAHSVLSTPEGVLEVRHLLKHNKLLPPLPGLKLHRKLFKGHKNDTNKEED